MHGYRWYDWQTGAIDRRLLAEDAARGLTDERYADVPAWAEGLPAAHPGATPTELATIDAAARNALLDHIARS